MITKLELDKILDAMSSETSKLLDRNEYAEFINLLDDSDEFGSAVRAALGAAVQGSALGFKVADGSKLLKFMFFLGFKTAEIHLKKPEIGLVGTTGVGKGGIQ
jgi:hypothetical protein